MQLGEEMEEEAMNGYETYSATVQKSGCNCACVGGALAMGACFFCLLVMLFQWHIGAYTV